MQSRTGPLDVQVEGPPGPSLDDWNLLRSFLMIYETGSLTAAAQRLGGTQPSMGRHLRSLETQLGETLFVRLPGSLKATARADALFAATATMSMAVRDARRVFTEQPQQIVGVVRVAAAEAHAYHVLPQMLGPLLNEQPELEIELSVSNRAENLLRRDADIAVRFFRPQQEGLIARKVGQAELALYAHDSFLARYGQPQGFDLAEGAFVTGFDRALQPLAPALRQGLPDKALRFRWRSDSVLAHQAVVEAGCGLGMYFTDIAATRPGLKRVLPDLISLPQEVWLCAHDELHRSARMRLVWDRLAQALEQRYGATTK